MYIQLSLWKEGGKDVDATLTEELLPALLEVATCTAIQSLSRQLAYLVAAQYMARINPEVHTYRIRLLLSFVLGVELCAGS